MSTPENRKSLSYLKVFLISLFIYYGETYAQIMPVTIEPDGGNKKAAVSEQLGIVKIDILYNRPGVKGREGKIWGTNVAHYGFKDLGHGTGYAVPWRAGANENTTMSFSHPVRINGQNLEAGKYGFFVCLGAEKDTLIFSRVNNSWGSFYYDKTMDALRVPIEHDTLNESVEWLKYEFEKQTDTTVDIALTWEKRKMSFRVSADTKRLQMEAFISDFRTTRPYYDFLTAIYWCIDNNYELEQALAWADRAIYFRVMGEKNFRTLLAKALVLIKLKRTVEATALMEEALPISTMQDAHYYGRKLIEFGLIEEAFPIFKFNFDRYPKEIYTHVGMARAYSARGDYKKAAVYLKNALPFATTEFEVADIRQKMDALNRGEDINK